MTPETGVRTGAGTAYLAFLATALLCCVSLLPPAVLGITYTLREESQVDSYIGNVSADSGLQSVVGEDTFANLRYSILSGGGSQTTSQLFRVSASSGVLTVADRIDREQLCPYADTCNVDLEIAAQYQSLLRKFDVEVVIQDINDNSPTFPRDPVPLELSEATSVDFPLSLDAATDLDGSAEFSVQNYSLVPADVPFRVLHTVNAVGSTQLSLVVSQPLDREQRDTYTLTLWAYDGGSSSGSSSSSSSSPPRSGSVTLSVTVTDVNDNAPEFTSDVYLQNISESTPAGTPVLTVTATDADEGDNAKVVYSVSSQQAASQQSKLSVDPTNGVVSLARQLKAGVHRVLVEAQDQGTPPKPPTQAVVELTVLDTDNNPPVLNLDLLSVSDFEPGFVPESAKVSTAVGFLAVSDPDSGANALVTCGSQNPFFELQSLDMNEYKIIISQGLNRENSSHFNVALVCSDGGSPRLTSTATFNVFVLDVNDNPPVFLEASYSASVAENNGPTDGLLQVAATDADAGNNANISYSLVGEHVDRFQIGAETGMIQARGQFDYEDTPQYVFTVLATDQGLHPLTGTAQVTVNVLDVNDESPRFSRRNYSMALVEGRAPGALIGNVTASDPDTGLGGQVELSIVPQPGLALPFAMTPAGVLTSTSALDRETHALYTITVLAVDKGMQPRSASALLTVTVLDLNDNSPVFILTPHNHTEVLTVPVLEERVVAHVHAVDPDAGVNGTVRYSVVGGNATSLFRVEENTGALVSLVGFLDDQRLGVYQLVIRATDQGAQPLHADRNFTLQVVRRTSSGPGQMVGGGGGSSGGLDKADSYVIIVICIVVFTAVVSVGVVVTMCVLRKVDRDKRMKYTAACCPDAGVLPGSDRDGVGSLDSSTDYHQQLPAVSSGVDSKGMDTGGFSFQPEEYGGGGGGRGMQKGGGGDLAPSATHSFPQQQQRHSNVRTSQVQLAPLSHGQHGRKTPLQLDVARRVDDFHSTSSAETTTGDSGHGSDEDIANHSHDRPLSPSAHTGTTNNNHYHNNHNHERPLSPLSLSNNNNHHHHYHNDRPLSPSSGYQNQAHQHQHRIPPPRPLRIITGGGNSNNNNNNNNSNAPPPFSPPRTGSSSRGGGGGGGGGSSDPLTSPDTSSSASSMRPIFQHGGSFRGSSSKAHGNSVRFSEDVRNYGDAEHDLGRLGGGGGGGRARLASNDSFPGDDDSDLNTTTSGSFSVPPDDLYSDFPSLHSGYQNLGGGVGGTKYQPNDMLV